MPPMGAKSRKRHHKPAPDVLAHREAKRRWTRWCDRWIFALFVSLSAMSMALFMLMTSLFGPSQPQPGSRDLRGAIFMEVMHAMLGAMREFGFSDRQIRIMLASILALSVATAIVAFLYLRQATPPRKVAADSKPTADV